MSEADRWPCLRIETSGKGRQARTRVILDTSSSPPAPRPAMLTDLDLASRPPDPPDFHLAYPRQLLQCMAYRLEIQAEKVSFHCRG